MKSDEALYNSDKKFKIFINILAVIMLSLVMGFAIAKGGILAIAAFGMLPFIAIFLNKIFLNPRLGMITILALAFIAIGLIRYMPVKIPLGLSVDAFLILIYIALFFKSTRSYVPWHKASSPLTYAAIIWFLYSLFELVNPEAISKVAWFYAMRGVSLYMLLSIPLVFILFDKFENMQQFFLIWGFFSLLGSLKGMMQLFVGVDYAEKAWLDAGNAVTHILFGKLRVFSFYSDAGQFGASQAHTGIVFSILYVGCKIKKYKRFYLLVAVLGFYGMLISGTRGAIVIPLVGLMIYFGLQKNIKMIVTGVILISAIFVFFKYTTIANGNAQIRRMRTAFDPNNPSLQVRLRNQKILKTYLASRPFGGGIGSAGNWGRRFSPNGFLANVPTDSWYVAIWAEQGVVGLTLHLLILFFILGKGAWVSMFELKNKLIKNKIMALTAGLGGIMAASYGNGILGQQPTGILLYFSMAYIFLAPKLEHELDETTSLEKA